MDYLNFFRANSKILLFAVILTLYSGFGQTFILSLYIPEIIADFQINQSLYSRIFAGATLLSGITIIFAGKIIDRISLKKFTILVITGIILANLVAGLSRNLIVLFLAIFLLRFFGQGMLSHTAMTSMGRYFLRARGKALSIAYLGFPLAEALLPIAIVSLILAFGWRETFLISAVFIFITLFPLVFFLLRNFDPKKIKEGPASSYAKTQEKTNPEHDKIWAQRDIVRTFNFYIFAPTVFIVGFTLTALFFYQTFIAAYKGWTLEWMALNITAYAIASFVFSILAGPLTDKFSARKLFPLILLPLILGLLVLIFFSHPLATPVYWFLVGVTAGINPTISNALYAETYGVKNLGSIRSIFTFVMVASTAMGPVTYSFLLDKKFTFDHIHLLLIGVILLNILFIIISLSKKRG